MPTINCAPFFNFGHIFSQIATTMFLVCKFQHYKRQQAIREDTDKKSITEKELTHLNHKIDKLLIKLEEEHELELAASPDEECVICISAKATMQTFPCGHRVVCRKCFVKTIQMAVSQRMLPLRCVICRSKILRLKQTSHGGFNTGHVLRNSRSTTNNPFYLSPANSPVSPVTEVFREQRAVFVRHYDQFGYSSNGQSPVTSPNEAYSKSNQSRRSGCVLHKHCGDKSKVKSPHLSPSSSSPSSSSTPSPSSPSSSSSSTFTPSTSRGSSSQRRSHRSIDEHDGGAFQWQFNRKRKFRAKRGLRRRHGNASGRPNSLLLPIDETEELQELLPSSASAPHAIPDADEEEESSMTSTSSSSSSINDKITKNNDDNTPQSNSKCQSLLKDDTPITPSKSGSKFTITLKKAKGWIKRSKKISN